MLLIEKITILILVTFIPALELRASIPLGILSGTVHLPFGLTLQGFGLHWASVFFICVLTNIVLGPIVYIIIKKFIKHLIKYKAFNNPYQKLVVRTQRKIDKFTRKYGEWAVAAFIAIPLPGSGSYTGALAAYLIGLRFKKFIISNIIGSLIAGILVTFISLGIFSLF